MKKFIIWMTKIITILFIYTLCTLSQNISKEIIAKFIPGIVLIDSVGNVTITNVGIASIFQQWPYTSFVLLYPNYNSSDTLLDTWDGRIIKKMKLDNIFLITMCDTCNRDYVITELEKYDQLIYAEKNQEFANRGRNISNGWYNQNIFSHLVTLPNDPLFNQQWNLFDQAAPPQQRFDIRAAEAWDLVSGRNDTKIAIVDKESGIDYVMEELNYGKGDGHYGTLDHANEVAGVVGAISDNNFGIAGIDWGAKIYGINLESPKYAASNFKQAIENFRVHIITNSWGQDPDGGWASISMARAFAEAYDANIVCVNSMPSDGNVSNYPNLYGHGIINTGATRRNGYIAGYYINHPHSYVDVVAPGGEMTNPLVQNAITSTITNNSFTQFAGTSASAAHVSGVCGLIRDASLVNFPYRNRNDLLDQDDYKEIVRRTATPLPGKDPNLVGMGLLNAEQAVIYIYPRSSLYGLTHIDEPISGGDVVEIQQMGNMLFTNLPQNIPARYYYAERYTVERNIVFPFAFYSPHVWGRGKGSFGYSAQYPVNIGTNYCEVVPGTVTNTGARFRTYVYKLTNIIGQQIGWFPCESQYVRFSYTVVGVPDLYPYPPLSDVIISGPECMKGKEPVTWSATPVYGTRPYTYQWSVELPASSGYWIMLGSSQSQSRLGSFFDINIKCVVRDNVGAQKEKIMLIRWDPTCGYIPYKPIEYLNTQVAKEILLLQNYPNPFNPFTTIDYNISAVGSEHSLVQVSLKVYDSFGREVQTLFDGYQLAGYHSVHFNGQNFSSGVYSYRLNVDGKMLVKTMALIK